MEYVVFFLILVIVIIAIIVQSQNQKTGELLSAAQQDLGDWDSRTKMIRKGIEKAQELLDELSFIKVKQKTDSRDIYFEGNSTGFSYLSEYEYPKEWDGCKELIDLQELCKLMGSAESGVLINDYTLANIKQIKRDAKSVIVKLNREADVRDDVAASVRDFLTSYRESRKRDDWIDEAMNMFKVMEKTYKHMSSNTDAEMKRVLTFSNHVSEIHK